MARGWSGSFAGGDRRRVEDNFNRPYVIEPAGQRQARTIMLAALTTPAVFIVVVMASIAVFGRPDRAGSAIEVPAQTASADILEQPARGATTPTAVALQSDAFVAAPVLLDAGARVTSISLDGDRIAMHVESENGVEIVVYDLTRGRTVAAVPIRMSSISSPEHLAMVAPIALD